MSAPRFDVSNVLKRIEALLQSARRIGQSAQAIGNWAQVLGASGAPNNAPHTQTSAAATNVVALSVVPKSTGLFLVGCKASYSDGTTGGQITHSLFSKQGTTAAGALAGTGFLSQVKTGVFAPTAKGGILNADAAGGGGITFEGSATFSVFQSSDAQGTLTGLLTVNGTGTQNFEFFGVADAVGAGSATKTPFTLGLAACIALAVSSTAAHVITYDTVTLFAAELPFG
ncbi:MAG TPA: hypothetical protein VE987_03280 [Polyangiaceae bacterium]|nr:hypothetical protein [Polyangiaceae bacterium]